MPRYWSYLILQRPNLPVLAVNLQFTSTSLFAGPSEAPQNPAPSGSWDLSELLSEIRHLRLQLEKSIQTNTALREKLEEQLLKAAPRSETININYLLSSPGTEITQHTHILEIGFQ